jgi:hypothetical protein
VDCSAFSTKLAAVSGAEEGCTCLGGLRTQGNANFSSRQEDSMVLVPLEGIDG